MTMTAPPTTPAPIWTERSSSSPDSGHGMAQPCQADAIWNVDGGVTTGHNRRLATPPRPNPPAHGPRNQCVAGPQCGPDRSSEVHTPGKVQNDDAGNVANDHYHRYKEGVAPMRSFGVGPATDPRCAGVALRLSLCFACRGPVTWR
jgi:hypothetical protein